MKTTLLLLASLALPLFAVELPADAAALKGKRDAKIAEINQLYANELGKLQKVALKNTNLEAANAIEKEIASVVVNPLKDSIVDPVGQWKWGSGGMLTIQRNGSAQHSTWNHHGSWSKVDTKSFNLISDNGMEFVIRFKNGSEGTVYVGTSPKTEILKIQ